MPEMAESGGGVVDLQGEGGILPAWLDAREPKPAKQRADDCGISQSDAAVFDDGHRRDRLYEKATLDSGGDARLIDRWRRFRPLELLDVDLHASWGRLGSIVSKKGGRRQSRRVSCVVCRVRKETGVACIFYAAASRERGKWTDQKIRERKCER